MTPPNPTKVHCRGGLRCWLLAAALGASGCQNSAKEQRVPVAEPQAVLMSAPPSAPTTAPTAAGDSRGARAMIEVAGKPVAVTTADAGVLQSLLIARLEGSQLEQREVLLRAARGAVDVQPTSVNIGGWILRDYGGKLTLYHRGPAPAVFHVAEVTGGSGTWAVKEVSQGEILMRPRQ
jgi:hypothetical protein